MEYGSHFPISQKALFYVKNHQIQTMKNVHFIEIIKGRLTNKTGQRIVTVTREYVFTNTYPGAARMITMKELAALAGVSQPTVSRVLNGNTSVNPEVAKKVWECAREHNYQPNMIARSLNGSKTCLLAVMVPDIANPFFADVIKAIEGEAEKAGYSILIFNSDFSQEKEKKYLGLLQQYRVDGLLVAPIHGDEESMRPFRKLAIPWRLLTKCAECADSIYISHERAGSMVAEHLLSVGAEKFVFVGKRTDDKVFGFEKGLAKGGVDTAADLKVFWEKDMGKMLEKLTGYLLSLTERAGIFASNDMDALVVMNALLGAGIEIPEKAALVGFDNTFISSRMLPGITSVNQPIEEMCRFAVEDLLKQIQEKKPRSVRHTEFSANLVVRASTVGKVRTG